MWGTCPAAATSRNAIARRWWICSLPGVHRCLELPRQVCVVGEWFWQLPPWLRGINPAGLGSKIPKDECFTCPERCGPVIVPHPRYWLGWVSWWWQFSHEPLVVSNTSRDLGSLPRIIKRCWISCSLEEQRVAIQQSSVIWVCVRVMTETSHEMPCCFSPVVVQLGVSIWLLRKEQLPKVKPQGDLQEFEVEL